MKKWCSYGRKLFISVAAVWCKASPVLLRKDRLPGKMKEKNLSMWKNGQFSESKNVLSAPWWLAAVLLQVSLTQLKTCQRWNFVNFVICLNISYMKRIFHVHLHAKKKKEILLFKDTWKLIIANPVVSYCATSWRFYLKGFFLWSQDDLGPAGGVYLALLVYLICLSDSFALSDSQRAQGDGKLPHQWRRHAAGRKWDAAQRCKLSVAKRERRLLLHIYKAWQVSICSPVFQHGRRSMSVRTTFG